MRHCSSNDQSTSECEGVEDKLRRLEPLIRSVVARFAWDQTSADELAQACRVRIYERWGQCSDPQALFGWASVVCQRVCLTAARNEQRDRKRLVQDEECLASVETSLPDPMAAAETSEMCLRVRSALERLPAEERRLLMLRYWDGISAAEIARRLDLHPATVRTRVRRACLRLRRAPEIVCYAPRRPPVWPRRSEEDMMDELRNGPPTSPDGRAP